MITKVDFPREGDAVISIEIPRRPDGSHNIAAAFAALDRALSVNPEAFAPPTSYPSAAEIATYETGSATGGGLATHYVEPNQTTLEAIADSYAGNVFSDLTPATEALMETQAEDPPFRSPEAPVGDGEALPEAAHD